MQNVISRYKRIIWQSVIISLASGIIATVFNIGSGRFNSPITEELVSTFLYAFCIGTSVCLAILYLNSISTPEFEFSKLLKTAIAIIVSTSFGILLARLILGFIFYNFSQQRIIPTWRNYVFSLGMAFTFGFAFYFFEISQTKLRQKELEEEKARSLAAEAQLASLESRIHPHFLFNTLNSIAALIKENPNEAEKMVEKLSALLRYSLDENSGGTVLLEKELEITRKYLEIEKTRFDKRLLYKIESEHQLLVTKIPPLSLQTLAENSIKHVVSKTSKPTEIVVSITSNGELVKIQVCDSGDGFDESSIIENHGLDNLRKRLKAIFGDQAKLKIAGSGKVSIEIPK